MFILIKKLFWSCQLNPTKFQPKRHLLDRKYPRLCFFYDQFVYSNQDFTKYLTGDPQLIGTIFELLTKYDGYPYPYPSSFGMNETEAVMFQEDLMTYATNNMIKITTYIESPYVSKYQTDQVGSMI